MINIEELKSIFKKLGPVDTILIVGALLSLFLLFSSKQDELLNLSERLFNLEWYWYAAVIIIAAIRPVLHLKKIMSKKTLKISKKK